MINNLNFKELLYKAQSIKYRGVFEVQSPDKSRQVLEKDWLVVGWLF